MRLIYTHVGISDVAIEWLKAKATAETKATATPVSMADILRRAVGEYRQRILLQEGKP